MHQITKESAKQTAKRIADLGGNSRKLEPVKVALLYSDSRSEQGETPDKTSGSAFVEWEDNNVSTKIQMSQVRDLPITTYPHSTFLSHSLKSI